MVAVVIGCSGPTPSRPITTPTGTGTPATSGRASGTVATGSAAGIRIGLVAPANSNPFGQAVAASITAQVHAAGASLIGCDPGQDAMLVLDCARRMATERVNGWIVVQPGDLGQALCDAGPKSVPLIVIGGSPPACATAGVGADDHHAGLLVGTELGKTELGKQLGGTSPSRPACVAATFIIMADGSAGAANTQRVAGILAGVDSQCPGKATTARIVEAGTQDSAYDAFAAAITGLPKNSDILVAAVNDAAAMGVAAAIPESRSAHVRLAAIGADPLARCQMISNPRWIGDAALFPDRYGKVAVPALLNALSGQRIPTSLYVQTSFLTTATFGDFYDSGECPAR